MEKNQQKELFSEYTNYEIHIIIIYFQSFKMILL